MHSENAVGACGGLVHWSLERKEEREESGERTICTCFKYFECPEMAARDGHKTERKFYSPSASCFIFKQQKHVAFDSYFVLAPTGLEIKATPCVTDEQ